MKDNKQVYTISKELMEELIEILDSHWFPRCDNHYYNDIIHVQEKLKEVYGGVREVVDPKGVEATDWTPFLTKFNEYMRSIGENDNG